MSDIRHDLVRTHLAGAGDVAEDAVAAIWADLEMRLLSLFEDERLSASEVTLVRAADLRYAGQEHTVAVQVPAGAFGAEARALVCERFHEAHERLYTFRLDVPIEFVAFRLTGFGAVRKPPLARIPEGRDVDRARKGRRSVDFDELGRLESAVFDRDRLGAGAVVEGPAVIEEPATSTLVLPGASAEVDTYGNLIVRTRPACSAPGVSP